MAIDVHKPEIFRGHGKHWYVGWYGLRASDRRPAHRIARCCTFRYAHEFLTMLYLLGWVVRDA